MAGYFGIEIVLDVGENWLEKTCVFAQTSQVCAVVAILKTNLKNDHKNNFSQYYTTLATFTINNIYGKR